MLTILEQSVSEKKSRTFRTHTFRSSNSPSDSKTETFWHVDSNFRRHRFIDFLKMKVLVEGLSLFETRLLFDIPGVLEDDLFIDALRAWKSEIPRETLWTRLQLLLRLEQRSVMSPNIYFQLKGTLYYKIIEARQAIGHVKKYSGYVRNSSSVGSKKSSGLSIPEPGSFEWTTNVEKDFFLFLTVGESSGLPGGVFSLKRPQKGRNGDFNLK